MTDQDPFYAPPSVPALVKRKCCWKKAAAVVLALIILAGTAVAALPFCPWIQNRIAGNQTAELRETQQQLASLQAKVTTLETRINGMSMSEDIHESAGVAPTAKSTDIAHLQSDVVALSSAVSAMQNDVKQASSGAMQAQQTAQSSLAAAIAFIQLRAAALSGGGFTPELKAMRDAAKNDGGFQPPLNALEPLAAQGAPTLAQLQESLIAQESDVTQAIAKTDARNWWERILAELKSLVSIRPLHGGRASDALTDMESDLARNDIQAALDAMTKLPPDAQQALDGWRAQAEARQKISDALSALAAHFTALSGPAPQGDK